MPQKTFMQRMKYILENPVKSYKKALEKSIIPKPYSHQIKMNLLIKKGQKSGTALVPCTIYAMDHQLEINPSLIRKKDKKLIKYIDPLEGYDFKQDEKIKTYRIDETNKVISYNPNNIVLETTSQEKKEGYEMKKIEYSEFERCRKCGQKVVLSEVRQTRYRSCPEIHVKLADPAKADTVIPVEFGVNKTDILTWPIIAVLTVGGIILFTILLLWPSRLVMTTSPGLWIPPPSWALKIGNLLKAAFLIFLWVFMVPRLIYKPIKLMQWYKSVKKTMKVSKYANY